MGRGYLTVKTYLGDGAIPLRGIVVLIKELSGRLLYTLVTDENGDTDRVPLPCPDKRLSQTPEYADESYSAYDVEIVQSGGFRGVNVFGVTIFDTIVSILPVRLEPVVALPMQPEQAENMEIHIPPATVETMGSSSFGPEPCEGDDPDPPNEDAGPEESVHPLVTSPAFANEVGIPYHITVHLGYPEDNKARSVRVPFVDYIKNVASSEIFPTWDESAIYANVLCQISYALNRIYTLWYRSRGYDYDITNTTAFDQMFVYGRNIFENISRIVDEIFNLFLRRTGRREPFFAAYCNGTTTICAGLSQWGSQEMALRGYTPIEILRHYFPSDIQIVESVNFSENAGVYPGIPLREGSVGDEVLKMQVYLNRISGNYYISPINPPDGIFDRRMRTTVVEFQRIANLAADGIIGRATWYAITKYYVAVKNLAELESEGERIGIGETPPGVVLRMGSRGENVVELQFLLNFISEFFPTIPFVIEDGVFRELTRNAVIEFQREFGLVPDGIAGPATWNALYAVYHSITASLGEIGYPEL